MTRSPARTSSIGAAIAVSLLLTAAPAFAQIKDQAPVALQSADQLAQDRSGAESWTYINPAANFTKYRTVIIDPAVVYDGPDAQFSGIDPAQRAAFAQILTSALRSEISKSFPSPRKARADTLRVRMTLLGGQKTRGGIATATRVTPIGFGLSAAKSLLGRQGTLTGSVLYAVEVFDASSGELLLSAVRRRTPDPLDIPATLSTEATVKAVAREFAVTARRRLEIMTQARQRR
jgi:hypothetical protein